MKNIKVLHIGIKTFPYNTAFDKNDLYGLRGGGMNKYTSILIESICESVDSVVITQRLYNQNKYEYTDGIHIYRVRVFGGRLLRQIVLNLKSIILAIKIIKRHDINILHSHLPIGALFGYLLSKIFKIKNIVTPYSFVTMQGSLISNKIAKIIEKYIYIRFNRVIFETSENFGKFREIRKVNLNNVNVIQTGVDIPADYSRNPKTNSKLRVFYIGRLVKIKALDNLIKSVMMLDKAHLGKIHIDIIGEGELESYFKLLIRENNLEDIIKIHGFIKDTEIYYKECDVFILPSYMEGLSISLLEAMGYGKACIVNNFGVPFRANEVYIMPNNHPSTIAKTISHFIDNRHLIYELGVNARERIIQDYSIETFANKYISVYQQLVCISK